ncbi:MAG: 2-oxo acid dehydrogenase subunit E2, partial [Nitratireductor sp.]|nr:2-oxo acid dehydrogenase subunit E2 [Nitratireductor sp.]
PAFIRKLVWWWSRRSPQFRKDSMGTVHVTAVGMFADGFDAGWAIPVAPWPLILTIGTISKRLQRMPDGEDGVAEFINLTLTIDHDVVDGAPATRFLVHFKQLLESGDGLESFRSA